MLEPATLMLRPYQAGDLEETVQLWYRSWHAAYPDVRHPQTLEEWKARLRDEISQRETVWVAEMLPTIVGSIAVDESEAHLHQLFVLPEYQGRGIGAALMRKAKHLCPSGLWLYTLQRNTKARRFYEKHEFTPGAVGINPVNGQASIQYRWKPAALAPDAGPRRDSARPHTER